MQGAVCVRDAVYVCVVILTLDVTADLRPGAGFVAVDVAVARARSAPVLEELASCWREDGKLRSDPHLEEEVLPGSLESWISNGCPRPFTCTRKIVQCLAK